MRPLVAFLFITAAAAGCFGAESDGETPPKPEPAPSLDDLSAARADETSMMRDGSRVFRFGDVTQGQGADAPLTGPGANGDTELSEPFDVDGRVGYVLANVTFDANATTLVVRIVDAEGQVHCVGYIGYGERSCSAPVNASMTLTQWRVEAVTAAPTEPGTPFDVVVTLAPRAVLDAKLGDPLTGVDSDITFRTSVSDPGGGGEPSLGVMSDGTILVQSWLDTMRSTDAGRTWEDVTPSTEPPRSDDPVLAADPWTDRVYVSHLYIACAHLYRSDDAGNSWLYNPRGCGAGGGDHQKIAIGPPPGAGVSDPIVYYHYATGQSAGLWTARSLDGGITWHDVPVVGQGDGRLPSVSGPITADRDGNVHIALYMCDDGGYVGVATSRDEGLSYDWATVDDEDGACWDAYALSPEPGDEEEHMYIDAGVAVDTAGTAYIVYDRPSGVKYSYSADHGTTWRDPVVISPPTLGSRIHTAAVAGDPGELAVLYRATADTDRTAETADGWAAWHMYVAFVSGADTEDPTIRTALINDPVEPTHRGPACAILNCPDRNLYDFVDVDVLPDGRVVAAYAHGCEGACATLVESEVAIGMVAVLEEGPRLFAERAPWAAPEP